jgi:hypothetical protein
MIAEAPQHRWPVRMDLIEWRGKSIRTLTECDLTGASDARRYIGLIFAAGFVAPEADSPVFN